MGPNNLKAIKMNIKSILLTIALPLTATGCTFNDYYHYYEISPSEAEVLIRLASEAETKIGNEEMRIKSRTVNKEN